MMDAKQLLTDLRDALKAVTSTDQPMIQVDALTKYLDNWEESAVKGQKQTEIQHARQLEEWKMQLSVSSASSLEMFKAVIEAGQTALKSSIVINGGAAAALIALMSEGLKANGISNTGSLLSSLGYGWLFFMFGLGCAGTATAARYLSQAFYAEAQRGTKSSIASKWRRFGNWARNMTAILGIASFGLFFVGAVKIFLVMR
jgi:hypothetical protein